MIFSLVLLLKKELGWTSLEPLSIVDPWVILGMLAGGSVIYWFCGASMQAVTTGAYRAVDYIKKHIKLDGATKASASDSNEVVRICTKYAQAGMINIFVVVFAMALAIAFINPQMFCAYLISIALFGLSSRRSTWPTPAAAGITPRRWSRSSSSKRALRFTTRRSWVTSWAIPSRTPPRWP
jgi:K(+)-stimulated pyrophosphate-energized sodium pump